jgi:hypothetical protein
MFVPATDIVRLVTIGWKSEDDPTLVPLTVPLITVSESTTAGEAGSEADGAVGEAVDLLSLQAAAVSDNSGTKTNSCKRLTILSCIVSSVRV